LHRCRRVRLPPEVSEPPSSIWGLDSKSVARRECRCRPAQPTPSTISNATTTTTTPQRGWPTTRYGLSTVLEACALWSMYCLWVGSGLDDVWIWYCIVVTWSWTASPRFRQPTCIAIAFIDTLQSSTVVHWCGSLPWRRVYRMAKQLARRSWCPASAEAHPTGRDRY
jgi:hypothetical protein